MKKVEEVKVGDKIESPRHGSGMVTDKTKKTVIVTFENGVKVKNTYRYSDDYFYGSDF